jgi:hypothetical protein
MNVIIEERIKKINELQNSLSQESFYDEVGDKLNITEFALFCDAQVTIETTLDELKAILTKINK